MTAEKQNPRRIDFKSGVPDILYKQAGGRCSIPRCKNPTMGPYYDFEGAVNMGVACHIFSASENGPRGQGGKDEAFISSEKNGIWCCQYHAALIDKNQGRDYPADVLFAWKALAEARVRKQMNDTPSPLGWVESIEFTSFPVPSLLPSIRLSKNTLMWGKHASAKKSTLEVAASISNSRFSDRFIEIKKKHVNGEVRPATVSAKIIYSTVDTLEKEVIMSIEGPKLTRRINGSTCLLPPGDLEVVYWSKSKYRKQDQEDDIDYFMRILNIDKSALFALAELGANSVIRGEIDFVQAREYNEEEDKECDKFKDDGAPFYNLQFTIENRCFPVVYEALSGSEKDLLIIDLLISKAREISKERLTLVLIEDLAFGLDSNNFKKLLRSLEKENFQSIVSLPPARESEVITSAESVCTLNKLDFLSEWQLSVIAS